MKKRNYHWPLKIVKNEGGFTLIELLIVLLILTIITLIVIAALNPIEQLNKARDRESETYAENLLAAIERYEAVNARPPSISAVAPSIDCNEIIQAGPVTDFSDLKNELSDWFGSQLTDTGKELYAGINLSGRVKVCYRVLSVINIKKSVEDGCNEGFYYFNCLPH